jgi:hypothetical protein
MYALLGDSEPGVKEASDDGVVLAQWVRKDSILHRSTKGA